jgi:hypothetical protein
VRTHALTPPFAGIGDDPHQEDVAVGLDPEARAERGDEIERDPTQFELLQMHQLISADPSSRV